ncbi:hypothetical protein C8F01DRAFT_1367009 [Mycena amicta]|nr:hypothetical protein C8F01DRAFT_1367009 [Mycena amicta]
MKARVLCHQLPNFHEPGAPPTHYHSSAHSTDNSIAHDNGSKALWSHCEIIPDLGGGPFELPSLPDSNLRVQQNLVGGIALGMTVGILLCAIPFILLLRKFAKLARSGDVRGRWLVEKYASAAAFPGYDPFFKYDRDLSRDSEAA